MLAVYFILAFLTMLIAPVARWVKYVSVTCDVAFLCGLYHLLYRAQYPEPVQYPFAPAMYLCLIVTTTYIRYSVACTVYAGAVAITGYLSLVARWGMPVVTSAQSVMTLSVLTAVVTIAVARSRQLALRAAEREVARALLEQKLPKRVAAALVDDEGRRDLLAVTTAEVSVLCVEAHEFAAMAEMRTPREVADLVERFAAVAEAAVFRYGGSIERFQGDRMVALFGAPIAVRDHAQA